MKKEKNKIFHEIVDPLLPKFSLHDFIQVIIGASILAVPVGFTEETWKLGENLPVLNIIALLTLSLVFITTFTYYQYHHKHKENRNWSEFTKRVFFTYVFSFLVVALILSIIQRAPWGVDSIVAFKRVAIVTFPSSMSAAIADTLK